MTQNKRDYKSELEFIDTRLRDKKVLNMKMVYGGWFLTYEKEIRAALAQTQQEAVAWLLQPNEMSHPELKAELVSYKPHERKDWYVTPLYTTPQQGCVAALEKQVSELQALVAKKDELLGEVRKDKDLWRIGKGGQDKYAGLPPALRLIDQALSLKAGDTQSKG